MPAADDKLQLYLSHRAALVEYVLPIVGGDRMRAEDIVQEAYLRFTPASADASKIEKPAAYLYRIVRNLALDLRRSLSADSRRDEAHLTLIASLPAALSPEEQALQLEELRLVEAALAELPADMRRAFEMRRIGGHTLQEISDHLGVSVATAGRWTHEALAHVSRRLQRQAR